MVRRTLRQVHGNFTRRLRALEAAETVAKEVQTARHRHLPQQGGTPPRTELLQVAMDRLVHHRRTAEDAAQAVAELLQTEEARGLKLEAANDEAHPVFLFGHQCITKPPSTLIVWPVTSPARAHAEKYHHVGDVLRNVANVRAGQRFALSRRPNLHTTCAGRPFADRARLAIRPIERRLHHTGANGVHSHVVPREVFGHALREVDVAALLRYKEDRSANRFGPATLAMKTMVPPRRSTIGGAIAWRDVRHAHDVDFEHARPIGGREIRKRKGELARADRGGMGQVVDRAQRRRSRFAARRRPCRASLYRPSIRRPSPRTPLPSVRLARQRRAPRPTARCDNLRRRNRVQWPSRCRWLAGNDCDVTVDSKFHANYFFTCTRTSCPVREDRVCRGDDRVRQTRVFALRNLESARELVTAGVASTSAIVPSW